MRHIVKSYSRLRRMIALLPALRFRRYPRGPWESSARGQLKRRMLSLVGILLAGPMLTASTTPGLCTSTLTCLRALEQAQRETRTITGRFVQTKRLSLLNEDLVSTGSFVFKQPDHVLWKVEEPRPMAVLVTGQEVRIPGLPDQDRRAMATGPIPAMFRQLGAILTGSVETAKQDFDMTAHEEGKSIRVKMVPREPQARRVFRELHVSFSGEHLLVQEIRLENALGDSLDISFSEVQRNRDVSDSTFDPGAYE
jgi:outer membrane lipoprotein-sorting protein